MKLTLTEKREEVVGVTSFIFSYPEPLSWKPGHYIHYVLHHEPTDTRGSDRWFTNAAAPFEQNVRITTRINLDTGSSFKKELARLEVGKEIEMSVVEGDFTLDDPTHEYVFIAGGIGITPFRSMLVQMAHDAVPIRVTLLYANRDRNIVYQSELEEIAKRNPDFKIDYVISPERVDENKIKELVPDFHRPVFYISGPEPMVDALGEMLKKMGVTENHIKQDWFPGYSADLS